MHHWATILNTPPGGLAESRTLSASAVLSALLHGSAVLDSGLEVVDRVFNVVTDFHAPATGYADDAPSFQAAWLAAHNFAKNGGTAMVLFPPGNYAINSSWSMPSIRTNDWVGASAQSYQRMGTVIVSGYGANVRWPTYNGSARTGRYAFLQAPNPGGNWVTYGNLVIEGFDFDNNYRWPSGNCGTIFWAQGEKTNIDNVIIRDCTTNHVPARSTFGHGMQDNKSIAGIHIGVGNVVGAAHWSYTTNIYVYNCDIQASTKPIFIGTDMGASATGEITPHLFDQIHLDGGTYDNLNYVGSTCHLIALGCGNRISVKNGTHKNCTDDAIEINAANDVLVEGNHFENNRQPVNFTWFSYPYLSSDPHYVMRGNDYSGLCGVYESFSKTTNSTDGLNRSPMLPEVLWKAAMTARRWGHFTVENETAEFGVANHYDTHLPLIQMNAPMESVTINNVDVTDVGTGGTLISINQRSNAGGLRLPISIHDVRWRSSAGGSYSPLPRTKCSLTGSFDLSTDMPS